MAKFHINAEGVPAICRAKKGNCPFGGVDSHYNSKEEAQVAADKMNEEKHGLISMPKSDTYYKLLEQMQDFKNNESKILKQMNYHKAEETEGVYEAIKKARNLDGDKLKEELDNLRNKRDKMINDYKEKMYNEKYKTEEEKLNEELRSVAEKIYEEEIKANETNSGDCPECSEGQKIIRQSKYGKFIGCNRFPKCKFTDKYMKSDVDTLIIEHGRITETLDELRRKLNYDEPRKLARESDEYKKIAKDIEKVNRKLDLYNYTASGKTPIEEIYEKRKLADDKIEQTIGKNKLAICSGNISYYSPETIEEKLTVDHDGNINNLFVESYDSGNVKRVMKIQKVDKYKGVPNMILENDEEFTMYYISNWNMRDPGSPNTWKFYVSEPNGEEYTGFKQLKMENIDSSD